MSDPSRERVTVGLVRGLHGLHGGVRVEVLSDDAERFTEGSVVYADGESRPLTVRGVRPAKPGIVVRFEEVTTREAAERLRDRYLEAIPESPLPAGTWYWHELEGLTATTREGETLGEVVEVFRAGEGEVYVVRGGTRGEVLVPAVRDVVVELDPPSGRLVVDAGVLGLEPADPSLPPEPPASPGPDAPPEPPAAPDDATS